MNLTSMRLKRVLPEPIKGVFSRIYKGWKYEGMYIEYIQNHAQNRA
jgi:hypothetical protein